MHMRRWYAVGKHDTTPSTIQRRAVRAVYVAEAINATPYWRRGLTPHTLVRVENSPKYTGTLR